MGALVAVLSLSCQLPQKLFWRSLRPINLLALFTIIAWAYINHGEASILAPAFSLQGLHRGGLYAARLALITLLTTLFFLTTPPQDAISLGIKSLKPLRLLGIEQHELSLLVHLAYRFIPLLRREIEEVRLGRLARNLPRPKGLARLKEGFDTLVFLFVGALKRAETMSFALEERGVVDQWEHRPGKSLKGHGEWMLISMVLLSALAVWKDGLLL